MEVAPRRLPFASSGVGDKQVLMARGMVGSVISSTTFQVCDVGDIRSGARQEEYAVGLNFCLSANRKT